MAKCGLAVLSVVFAVAFHSVARAQGPSPSMAPGPSLVVPQAPAPSMEEPMAPGPATSNDCMTVLLDNLSSCLTYVEVRSNLTRPEKGCCQGLAKVVDSQPLCLCSLLSSNEVYGVQIDRTKSLMLPTVCHVQTPPVSLCSVVGIPVPSPEVAAPVGPASPESVAGGPGATPPTGGGVDSSFGSSAMALLAAGLSLAAVAIF